MARGFVWGENSAIGSSVKELVTFYWNYLSARRQLLLCTGDNYTCAC